jgi:poly-gamma-glutamate biosynthesis protein PgsC/CapC
MQVLGTVVAALVTYLFLKLAGKVFLLYGRRTLVLSVLLGFLFGALIERTPAIGATSLAGGIGAIGYIIPGLLAYWMTRQGIVQTLSAMGVASVLVRLALIVLHGGALLDTALL